MSIRLLCGTVGYLLFSFCPAAADPPGNPSSANPLVSLIDDSTLNGWRGSTQDWQVDGGVLVGSTDGSLKSNRFIVADIEPVKNFELLVDVWISPGGNSGIQYRSEERPDLGPHVVTGYQCDVVANVPQYNGMLYEERGRRILAHTGEKVIIDRDGQPWVVGKFPVQTFAPAQWHRFRVLVEGNHHRHWIDDLPTVDVTDLDEPNRASEGVIAVQVHVGPKMEIRYRNFRLRRLPDDLPQLTATDAPVPSGAVKVVPQGGPKRAGQRDKNAKLEKSSLGTVARVHRVGHVLLSGQPSQDDLRQLAREGFKTVITLRTPPENIWDEKPVVESAGMRFVELPVGSPEDLTDALFDTAREYLRAAAPGNGVCMHCASANRVGAVWLVHRVLDGKMTLKQARAEAAQVGLKSAVLEKKSLDYIARKQRR